MSCPARGSALILATQDLLSTKYRKCILINEGKQTHGSLPLFGTLVEEQIDDDG